MADIFLWDLSVGSLVLAVCQAMTSCENANWDIYFVQNNMGNCGGRFMKPLHLRLHLVAH